MLDFLQAFSDVNALAVFVGAIAAFAVGALWYSPMLFSNAWIKELGLKKDFMSGDKAKADMPKVFATDFALTVVLGIGIAMLLNLLFVHGLWNGVALGAFVGLFYSSVTTAINYTFEKRSLKLFAINAGYAVAMCVVIGGIVGVWPK